jgi:Ca-activated chloride channel family protein
MLGDEAQQLALNSGLRPVNPNVSLAAPLDGAPGVDVSQPAKVFGSPSVEAVYAVQGLWQAARKDVNLVMLLDTSGSMDGRKIDGARDAAIEFVANMGADDYLTVIAFSNRPEVLIHHERVGEAGPRAINALERLDAFGATTLYDAIGDGATIIANTTHPDTTNAMVVLTDGQDTESSRFVFDDELIQMAAQHGTTVFTIAYGGDADERLLERLALGANGNYYLGDEASIGAIYEEMSAAFGGSAGVGR